MGDINALDINWPTFASSMHSSDCIAIIVAMIQCVDVSIYHVASDVS